MAIGLSVREFEVAERYPDPATWERICEVYGVATKLPLWVLGRGGAEARAAEREAGDGGRTNTDGA